VKFSLFRKLAPRRKTMTDNMLADFLVERMAERHFEVTTRELYERKYPKNLVRAARAVLVDGKDAAQAAYEFCVPEAPLRSALEDYSATWAKYCADNALVRNGFWLPTDMIPRAKAIETRALNRIERLRKEQEHASQQQKASV
jgi:hypothetical protein